MTDQPTPEEPTVGDAPVPGDYVIVWSSLVNLIGEGKIIEASEKHVRFMNEWLDGSKHDCTLAITEPLHRSEDGKFWYAMWDDTVPYETAEPTT